MRSLRSAIDATGHMVLSVERGSIEKKRVLWLSEIKGGHSLKNQDHLPYCGPGLVLGVLMFALTAGGITLSELGRFPKIGFGVLKIPAAALGVLLIVGGAAITAAALLVSKIHRSIESGKLLTAGVYAWVRNPIYSGIMFACTGAILIYGNLALIVFPLIMYLAITAAVKKTEEKWLAERFGEDYADYCKRVNRCIPWFPKR